MSVARTRHVLNAIDRYRSDHRQTVAIAAGGLVVAAFALAVGYGSLGAGALLFAVVAAVAATALLVRLRAAERSHAALLRTVADLTSRLDQQRPVLAAASLVAPTEAPVSATTGGDAEEPASDGRTGAAASGFATAPGMSEAEDCVVDEPVATAAESIADDEIAASSDDEVTLAGDRMIAVEAAAPDEAGNQADAPDQEPSPPVEMPVPESIPAFALTSLKGETVTEAELVGTPAVVVFWRPGCPHCQRLTPELVAWESLQGPRLIVFAACDGPTAFRSGLPGLVILDPGFTVGQAVGAPGTPAALPLDSTGRPSGPIVAGASAVTALLLEAMREWASVEEEPMSQSSAVDIDATTPSAVESDTVEASDETATAGPTILLRRVEEVVSDDIPVAPDWDDESLARRAG